MDIALWILHDITTFFSLSNILKDAEFYVLSEFRFNFLERHDSTSARDKISAQNRLAAIDPPSFVDSRSLTKSHF
jgi:hypothetical protein